MKGHLRYFAKGLWVDRYLSQWITSIMIIIHVGLGMVVLVGGIDRFSVPSFTPLIDYSNGNTWIYGVWIIISGVLMATPFRWPNIVGLWLGMAWHILWMASFAVAMANFPNSSTTPIPVYGGLALICMALLTARAIEQIETR